MRERLEELFHIAVDEAVRKWGPYALVALAAALVLPLSVLPTIPACLYVCAGVGSIAVLIKKRKTDPI